MKILFICKENDFYAQRAIEFLEANFDAPIIVKGKRGDKMPKLFKNWQGDLVISYLSPWIIPQFLLSKAGLAAINFHPGPPSYPGIGCTNFAIYNGETEFGITCHHMLAKVDTGAIIEVRYFPLFDTDTVWTLTQRCYTEILKLFYDLLSLLKSGKSLPQSEEKWLRKPYTRKELNQLCEINLQMSEAEALRRIKATTYDKAWAYVKIGGKTFKYDGK